MSLEYLPFCSPLYLSLFALSNSTCKCTSLYEMEYSRTVLLLLCKATHSLERFSNCSILMWTADNIFQHTPIVMMYYYEWNHQPTLHPPHIIPLSRFSKIVVCLMSCKMAQIDIWCETLCFHKDFVLLLCQIRRDEIHTPERNANISQSM